jgi:hypothetical protein
MRDDRDGRCECERDLQGTCISAIILPMTRSTRHSVRESSTRQRIAAPRRGGFSASPSSFFMKFTIRSAHILLRSSLSATTNSRMGAMRAFLSDVLAVFINLHTTTKPIHKHGRNEPKPINNNQVGGTRSLWPVSSPIREHRQIQHRHGLLRQPLDQLALFLAHLRLCSSTSGTGSSSSGHPHTFLCIGAAT